MPTAPVAAVSFDLFGTLIVVDRPADSAGAIAAELEARGVAVPSDWPDAYAEPHLASLDGVERSLSAHVAAALASRGASPKRATVEAAVTASFDPHIRTRDGATGAVAAIGDRVPVGVLSNCSVPGLAERALRRSALEIAAFDAVVTSVDCGWRKPHPRAFERAATALDVDVAGLLHVGDDPATDGGATAAGARGLLLEDVTLADLPVVLEGQWA